MNNKIKQAIISDEALLVLQKTIGQRLQKMRLKAGYSQAELAEKLCKTRHCIANVEQGRNNFTLKIMADHVNACDKSLYNLINCSRLKKKPGDLE